MNLFYYPDDSGVSIGPIPCVGKLKTTLNLLFDEWGPGEWVVTNSHNHKATGYKAEAD